MNKISALRKCYIVSSILSILFVTISCKNKDYTPKPIAYNRIDIPTFNYQKYQNEKFNFHYSQLAQIEKVKGKDSVNWFNIIYPKYDAIIYCSFLPITEETLPKVLEDSYHLAYSHSIVANAINQQVYTDSSRKIGGVMYQLEGDVATPIQFFITDSTSNFIRGSFYYAQHVNLDSVAPITNLIQTDIVEIFNTITFANK